MNDHSMEMGYAGKMGLQDLLDELEKIRSEMEECDRIWKPLLNKLESGQFESARNLLHYLVLRRRNLRPLQLRLAAMGLSSLGRAESHAISTVESVIGILRGLDGQAGSDAAGGALDFGTGERLLALRTEWLLGKTPEKRSTRIMVTMPLEAAKHPEWIEELLAGGMDCLRINCAHGDEREWASIVGHLRAAQKKLGCGCKLFMDLAGPKPRTAAMPPGPEVLRVRPRRDRLGRVVEPAKVLLVSSATGSSGDSAVFTVSVAGDWLAGLRGGMKVRFTDARGSKRILQVIRRDGEGVLAEIRKTAYFVPGTVLMSPTGETEVGRLPCVEDPPRLRTGDRFLLTRDLAPGAGPRVGKDGRVLRLARVGCTMPQILDHVRAGEAVWLDDGKLGGVVERAGAGSLRIRVTHARPKGFKLRADKGINLPDTRLEVPALTDKDRRDLQFVARHADLIGLSFANRVEDVDTLREALSELTSTPPALVLKIETRSGFEHLPGLLLSAMKSPACGVMIARGDLAVECGFERLAEVQEEILWICEAAHVPVIWATQVLETLAKSGVPSRAEISDAAMGHRAECVMLNKGPHAAKAVRALDDILQRMGGHQSKKRALFRELKLARNLEPAAFSELAPSAG